MKEARKMDPNINRNSLPERAEKRNLFVMAFFCFFTQGFCSIFLIWYFYEDKDDLLSNMNVDWTIHLGRFMAACLFHCHFVPKLRSGMSMLKYVSMHQPHFYRPSRAFTIALM